MMAWHFASNDLFCVVTVTCLGKHLLLKLTGMMSL